nr:PREDICTED: uncharacterized protein KIAA1614-like [Latimeria chalumnae]|eukprot:XP_014341089.1 PREDICTED: uncharacterized protein KIAA1614-like [Latimeria chalumnae]
MEESAVVDTVRPPRSRKLINKNPAKKKAHFEDEAVANAHWDLETRTSTELSRTPVDGQKASSLAVSTLQSKIRALREKRAVDKESKEQAQEKSSPRKSRAKTRQVSADLKVKDVTNAKEEINPQVQIHTYLTDGLMSCSEDQKDSGGISKGSPLSSPFRDRKMESPRVRGRENCLEKTSGKHWCPPKGFWRSLKLDKSGIEDNVGPADLASRSKSPEQLRRLQASGDHEVDRKKLPSENEEARLMGTRKELAKADGLEGSVLGSRGVPLCGELWRAESWESVGSGSILSLAERVEMNRAIVKQMLGSAGQGERLSQENCTQRSGSKETNLSGFGQESNTKVLVPTDSDWDSGISLQESEGSRAFVSSEEPTLSPRHEQAKRLLERARMKARSSPLKADHSILPLKKDCCPRQSHGSGVHAVKKTRNESPPLSGNLSDSSSGESNCGLQKKRGQSPTRVRFEDESARDAEVRYWEREQQRKKGTLDLSGLRGHGPLISKPNLSSYIGSASHQKENGTHITELKGNIGENKQLSKGSNCNQQVADHPPRAIPLNRSVPTVENENGKCSACGSYIIPIEANRSPVHISDLAASELQSVGAITQNHNRWKQGKEAATPDLLLPERPKGPVVSRVLPRWVLPSQHSIRTELIKETYIGEITYIDDIDSAVESTDTSEGL